MKAFSRLVSTELFLWSHLRTPFGSTHLKLVGECLGGHRKPGNVIKGIYRIVIVKPFEGLRMTFDRIPRTFEQCFVPSKAFVQGMGLLFKATELIWIPSWGLERPFNFPGPPSGGDSRITTCALWQVTISVGQESQGTQEPEAKEDNAPRKPGNEEAKTTEAAKESQEPRMPTKPRKPKKPKKPR